jgi:glycosyltransferase involved in cell wall biosynthesis
MSGRLLFVIPSVVSRHGQRLEVEHDFLEGLRLCLENFDEVRVCCPITPRSNNSGLRRSRPIDSLPDQHRTKFIFLPFAYNLYDYMRSYRNVKEALSAEIQKADYLAFSPHTLVGDWPTVAVGEAIKQNRRYAIEADVVYEKVSRVAHERASSWKRLLNNIILEPIFTSRHRRALRHSNLAMLQGQDVFDAYGPHCSNAHKVYHMPIDRDDYITDDELEAKLASLDEERPLKICYVGRAIDMKGPMDWLHVLRLLEQRGIKFEATWLGDGDLLSRMRTISSNVNFPGYISNHFEILRALRDSDIFLFCHKTPESPRCLVESLASGCPLVGYGSSYPRDIVSHLGGGSFVEIGDREGLTELVAGLAANRGRLKDLVRQASASGRLYERDATMRRRIDLIKSMGPYVEPLQ